jgi:hypothetical protein
MGYEGEESKHCARVEAAKRAVAKAMDAHSRGGKLEAVNRANADLADAQFRWYEHSGGVVPDDR